MKSMTGYACKESSIENITVCVEIRGYNNRFLDLSIHIPSWLSKLEPVIKKYMSSRFARGKVDVIIRLREENARVSVSVNENAAMAYKAAIGKLTVALDLNDKLRLETILGLEGVLEIETNWDTEKYWPHIEPVLVAAADQFEVGRPEGAGGAGWRRWVHGCLLLA